MRIEIATKPCPFCGSKAIVWGDEIPLYPSVKLARVTCPGCGAAGGNYSKRSEAIEAWNRRVYIPSEGELRELEERHAEQRRELGLPPKESEAKSGD